MGNVELNVCSQAVFHNFIARNKNDIFTGAADVIMERLSQAADAVGDALNDSLDELARKVGSRLYSQ